MMMSVAEKGELAQSSQPSSLKLDPLLVDLAEKKLSFKRNVVSLAAELKDARRRLVMQEQSFARETLTRKAVETKAKGMEEEIVQLQKCLQEKDEKLQVSSCQRLQYLKEMDELRTQLSTTQATADASAEFAHLAQAQCSNLLKELDEKNISIKEHEIHVHKLEEQLDFLNEELNAREILQRHLMDDVSRIEKEMMHAVELAGANQDHALRKILTQFSPKNFENINKLLVTKDEEIARLRDDIRILTVHWKNKTEQLESQLHRHQRTDQELKKKIVKLDFGLHETRSQMRKLHKMGEKRDKVLKELRDQLALKQQKLCTCCKEKQNFWESSGFKMVVSMSMLVLVAFTKK